MTHSPKKMLSDLLPTGTVSIEEKRGSVKVRRYHDGVTKLFPVDKYYLQGDPWYIGQLAKHITNTLKLDSPVFRRGIR